MNLPKWRILVGEAEIVPRGYGIAYQHPCAFKHACYPIPFNWLVRWWVNAYYCIRFPGRQNKLERELSWAFTAGYQAGLKAKARGEIEALLDFHRARPR